MIRRALADLGLVIRRFFGHDGFLLAGALAFSSLLCLAPLALLLVSGVGFLLQSDEAAASVMETATSLLPGYSSEVLAALTLLTQERKVTGLLGGLGLAVFATQLFSLTRTVTNVAFRVQQRRGLVHGFAFDLFALGVCGLLAVVLSGAILTVVALGNVGLYVLPPSTLASARWAKLIALPLLYLSLAGLLFFVYRTFPNTAVRTRAAATATVVVAVLWEAARWGFSTYLAMSGVYGKLYGSFGMVVATLVWIYFSATIFVVGAEIAAMLTERSVGVTEPSAESVAPTFVPPQRLRLAPYVLVSLLGAAAATLAIQNGSPITIHFLAWVLEGLPLGGVLLGSLAAGVLFAAVPLLIGRRRLQARLLRLEQHLAPTAMKSQETHHRPELPAGH
ncbi:MAG: YihY/virulence factor BrkB family protein [Deltaproteobacteria bacterium]|nr:YihY/virulence factor BrkB family protein [Deltaproteobacteria bacterium]